MWKWRRQDRYNQAEGIKRKFMERKVNNDFLTRRYHISFKESGNLQHYHFSTAMPRDDRSKNCGIRNGTFHILSIVVT